MPRGHADTFTRRAGGASLSMSFRAYFAFDYEFADDFRVNAVQNYKFTGDIKRASYFAKAPWDASRRREPAELKRLIDAELEGTFATIVLCGERTHARRWVRYEMFKSIEQGNALVGNQAARHRGKRTRGRLPRARTRWTT